MTLKVTQTARDAAAELIEAQHKVMGYEPATLQTPAEIREGHRDWCPEVQAFAAAEQRGQAAMRDKAAKVARECDVTLPLAPGMADGASQAANTIATAIESLPTEGEQP